MITLSGFRQIIEVLEDHPEPLNGQKLSAHIAWSESAAPPANAEDFALEAIFVICNSGMQHRIARAIFERCRAAIEAGEPVSTASRELFGLSPVFGHHGKAAAIDRIWNERERLLAEYLAAADKVAFCGSLPFIGEITKYHLAKNFGADCAKPDVHLVRLASLEATDPHSLCARLSAESGLRVRTVDLVLWMACAKGVLNGHTGEITCQYA
jgi:hypothetical protein